MDVLNVIVLCLVLVALLYLGASRPAPKDLPPPRPGYRTLDELVGLIDGDAGAACRRILEGDRARFETVQGSVHNHQAWPGGYADHVTEVMNVAVVLHAALGAARPLQFTLSDALLVMFLHDIEKPWKYEPDPEGGLREIAALRDKDAQRGFREGKLFEHGIVLTPEQRNALTYVEGEYKDYSNKRRVMGPLAAFCHLCDMTSARIWFDRPSEAGDPWPGACRVRQAR